MVDGKGAEMWFWVTLFVCLLLMVALGWWLRHLFLFAFGVTLVVLGTAASFVGVALSFGRGEWLLGAGLFLGGLLVGFFGWELIQKANEIGRPRREDLSPSGGSQSYISSAGHVRYGRYNGSSFGAGFGA